MADKARSEQNQTMLDTLFLDGANAVYLEQMQAKYAANPNSVDPSFRAYFGSLEDNEAAVKTAEGPVWKRPDWPIDPNGELTAALTGEWADESKAAEKIAAHSGAGLSSADVRQATKDSLGALMLIRAPHLLLHIRYSIHAYL